MMNLQFCPRCGKESLEASSHFSSWGIKRYLCQTCKLIFRISEHSERDVYPAETFRKEPME
jgi:transposase-like protein